MQEYGVPITGDTYYKLKHGPIGTVAYDILKKNEITIPQEIINLSNAAFKKEKEEEDDDSDVIYKYNRKADMDVFSKTNIDCMDKAINFCVKNKMQNKTPYAKSDYALSEVSHQEKAWRLAENFGARLDFELIIDDKIENREEIIKYMRDVARFICL
jgi:hypothetical protein